MMRSNIQDVLAYEIKKEIADRYFGFRKLIEEDSLELSEIAKQHTKILEKRISFDLIRIYILLKDEKLIKDFLDLIGLEEHLFYDPYLTESQTIKERVFEGIHLHGFTWRGRHKNMMFDIFKRLAVHIEQYRLKYQEMIDCRDTISEEIKIFYRNNDLGTILGFLHSLGSTESSSTLQKAPEQSIAQALEKKLKIATPEIPQDPPKLKPLKEISSLNKKFEKLVASSYKQTGDDFRTFFKNRTGHHQEVPRV